MSKVTRATKTLEQRLHHPQLQLPLLASRLGLQAAEALGEETDEASLKTLLHLRPFAGYHRLSFRR